MIMSASAPPPRRLAYLIESDGPGGAEQVVAHLAEAGASRGDAVVVFTPRDGEGWIKERLRDTPITVDPLVRDGPLSLSGITALASRLRHHRIGLLHTHEFGQAFHGAAAAHLARIPHLLTMHGGLYWAERWRRRTLLRLAARGSAALTAVSTPLAEALRRSLSLRDTEVTVIHNGVPATAATATTGPALDLPDGATLLLAVGNLYPVKGHTHLVAALARLAPRFPLLHLAIAGRGEEHGALAAQAAALGVGLRLHLLGLRPDVRALLARADVVVHPSLAEGLPLAVLEAMFAGRAIVASAVGELPTALAHGVAGHLVPPGDPVALADAIALVLTDRVAAAALGDRARTRAYGEYSAARMAELYCALYDRALDRRPVE